MSSSSASSSKKSSRSSKQVEEEQQAKKSVSQLKTLVNRAATGRLLHETGLADKVTIGKIAGKASDHDASGVSSLDKRGKEFLRKLSIAASDIASHNGAKTVSHAHVLSALKFLDVDPEFSSYPDAETAKLIKIVKSEEDLPKSVKYPRKASVMYLAKAKVERLVREHICLNLSAGAAALIQFALERHLMHILVAAYAISRGTNAKGEERKKSETVRIDASHISAARV